MPGPSVLGFLFDDGVKIALTPLDDSSTCSVVKVLSIIILYHVAATLYVLDWLLLLSHFPKQQRLVEIILSNTVVIFPLQSKFVVFVLLHQKIPL